AQARSEQHVRFGTLFPWPRRGVGISVKHDNLAGFSTCKGCPQADHPVGDDKGEMLGHGGDMSAFRHGSRAEGRVRAINDLASSLLAPRARQSSDPPVNKPNSVEPVFRIFRILPSSCGTARA